jgi:hypothetical protein
MIATGSTEIRQRTVAHELMHALDFEVLRVSSSADFRATYDKEIAALKKFTDEEVGDKDRKKTADITKAFEHYLSAPKEAWAEVGARIIFPHSNKRMPKVSKISSVILMSLCVTNSESNVSGHAGSDQPLPRLSDWIAPLPLRPQPRKLNDFHPLPPHDGNGNGPKDD